MKLKTSRPINLFFLIFLFLGISLSCNSQEYKKIKIATDLEVTQLSKNVYVHTSVSQLGSYGRVSSNGMLYIQKGKAFMFDSPATNEQTKQLVSWLQKSLHTKVIGFIPNHWHDDCMGGLKYLHSIGIKSYASTKTIAITKREHLPTPKFGFKDSLSLIIGSKPIKCYFLGEAHSKDNIIVWLPNEKILFPGCMVKELSCFKIGNIKESNLDEWPATIDNTIEKTKGVKIVIPGHGKVGSADLLEHTKELVNKELKFTNKLRRIFQNYSIE